MEHTFTLEPKTINNNYIKRIESIDLLRGVIILLMVLDHVRDFFGVFPFNPEDLLHTSPGLFLTRWITNLCAPVFVLLSGMSAYLYGSKVSKSTLTIFLIKRGFFLIFLEMTLVTYAWTFQLYPYMILQVLWALGISMIVLAGLIWLPRYLILLLSLIVIFGHNYFDNFHPDPHTFLSILWGFLHEPFDLPLHATTIRVLYPLLPWPALMGFGYCIGHWMKQPLATRNKKFFSLGLSALLLFIILRCLDCYGDANLWQTQLRGPLFTMLSFIKVTKYPPSLFYILETIGITTLLWPLWEYWQGVTSRFVLCFGKVAMFFYLIHLPFIHLLATLYSRWYFHVPGGWWWEGSGIPLPPNYHFNLYFVYAVWLSVILILYPACVWYMKFKEMHRYAWLRYL